MSQLPAHLQKYQAPDVGAALSQNLGSAMPPHVSIEGGRFKLIDASNNEIPVPTFDPQIGVYLDAVIIDVNEHMSRMYYIRDYDPSAAGAPPDCWSDNGVAASIGATSVPLLQPPHPRAGQPAATCAECPMAVWGSKISNLGSKIPACSQKQKMALLVPGFQTLFTLAVPPNSHKFLREYVERCKGNQVMMADLVTRISFVPGVQGTLQFNPVTYIDDPTAILRQEARAQKKTDALVGRNDVPRTAALAVPVTPSGTGQAPLLASPNHPSSVMQAPQQQVFQPAPQVQPQTFVQPAAAAPAPTAFGQFPSPSAGSTFPSPTANPVGGATTVSSSEAPATTPRRRRRTAAEMQAAQPGQPAPTTAQGASQQPGQAQQAPFPHAGQAASQQPSPGATGQAGGFPVSQAPGTLPGQLDAFPPSGTPQFGMAQGQPVGANPEVSAMLDNFFKQG